jgi:hypothetical protein
MLDYCCSHIKQKCEKDSHISYDLDEVQLHFQITVSCIAGRFVLICTM